MQEKFPGLSLFFKSIFSPSIDRLKENFLKEKEHFLFFLYMFT